MKLESMLNYASTKKYDQLLDKKKSMSSEWKGKWMALDDILTTNEDANTTTIDSIPADNEEELISLQKQSEEITMDKPNATDKVQKKYKSWRGQDTSCLVQVSKEDCRSIGHYCQTKRSS